MITDMHVHLMGDNGARLLASASHCGIGRLIVSDLADWSEFPEENAIRAGNDRAAAFAAGAPGRVFFLAYVNPQLDSAEEGRYPVEPDDAGRGQFLQLSGEEFEQVARGCDHFGRSGGGDGRRFRVGQVLLVVAGKLQEQVGTGRFDAEFLRGFGNERRHPGEAFRSAGEELPEEFRDRPEVGVDGGPPFGPLLSEPFRHLRQTGFLQHPDDGGVELPSTEERFRAVAPAQRVFDGQGDVLGHVTGFSESGREKTADQPGLKFRRVEFGAAAVEFKNENRFLCKFHHHIIKVSRAREVASAPPSAFA